MNDDKLTKLRVYLEVIERNQGYYQNRVDDNPKHIPKVIGIKEGNVLKAELEQFWHDFPSLLTRFNFTIYKDNYYLVAPILAYLNDAVAKTRTFIDSFDNQNLEIPSKITIRWLVDNAPLSWWVKLGGIVLAAFLFGITVGQTTFVQEIWGKKPISATSIPPTSFYQPRTLSAPQEKLLSLLWKYQRDFALEKIIVTREGSIIFDNPDQKNEKIDLVPQLFDLPAGSPEKSQKFESLMESMPTEFLRFFSEMRLDSPFVISVTDAGRRYLIKEE